LHHTLILMIKIKQAAALCRLSSRQLLTLTFPLFFLLGSCGNSTEKTPDVSNIKISLQTQRFDKDFSSIDTNHIEESLQKMHTKYPDFLNYYLDTFETFGFHGNYSNSAIAAQDTLKKFFTIKDFADLEDSVNKHYPDSKAIDAALTKGFQFMKYYFPNYAIPKILYINSYLSNFPTFPWDKSTICISLDHFLGDHFPFYVAVGIPPYTVAQQRESYIPVSVFNSVYQPMYQFNTQDKTLLDLMIQRGKEQYFLHKILPHVADSVLFGYPDHKVKWCTENEGQVYNFFIHQALLYSREPSSILPYINDGPFAVNFPVENAAYNTPGNIGTWLGYRIVCAYMAQNPSTTLQQLLDQQTDPAQFLDAAKYRPK
jgi:hypothetical protein